MSRQLGETSEREEARALLRELVARGGMSRMLDMHLPRERLLAVMDDAGGGDYLRLDAALALALAGDARAIPTLRRVFESPGFAVTNSLDEGAYAALGLALLGDVASLPRVRRALRINLMRTAAPLALALLEAEASRS
ncbi:hypothetical protein [Archangium sp.]|uniref:hypothetical protein n=1 Tax=Archangium sp. TaxID=1872627 RepID=UPI002D4AD495|nr:hypothetical protein [Archangium sp.]HYO54886.1 hypothetical protein [Archangium sp.]